MSRQGSGRAPIGLGISGGVVAVGVAAFCAIQTLRLRTPATTLGGPAAIFDRRAVGPVTRGPSAPTVRTAPAAVPAPAPARVALSPDVLFARAAPAVVRINVHDGAMKPIGHGTGFFVSADGLVVTNYHVIDGANYATVERSDGSVLRVEGVAAVDGGNDLALLKVSTDGAALPVLILGADELPRIGTTVYAIGHPLGLKNVLSEGLVSSLGDPARGQQFIQTTAAISPGSSGGPLMTADGVVVGVTTATVRDAQNLNFAMPAVRVRSLLGQPRPASPVPLSRALTEKVAAARPPAGVPDRALDRAIDRVWDAMKRDRLTEAAGLIAQLRGRGQGSAYFWFTSGTVHMRLNNDDLAVEAFRTSIRLKPDKLATYLNLGQVYTRQRKLQDAISTYDLAAKLQPSDARAFAQAGQAYAKHLKPDKAVPFFKCAIQLEPANAAHRRDLGVAYLSLMQRDAAIECFHKAIELEPDNGENHRNLGVVLLNTYKNGPALKALQKAVSLKPNDPEAYLFLGYAYHHAGNRQAAKEAWANADRFDTPTGGSGIYARQAMGEYARGRELTMPMRK